MTIPQQGSVWTAGQSAEVWWTSQNLTENVNIRLSTDSGFITFPIVLVNSTINDGVEQVAVPSSSSVACRIRVESAVNPLISGASLSDFSIVDITLLGEKILFYKGAVGSEDSISIPWLPTEAARLSLLYNDTGFIQDGRWSVDKNLIVFSSQASSTGKRELFTISANGQNPLQITATAPMYGNNFAVFKGADKIWYINAQTTGISEVWEISLDGSNPLKLSNTAIQFKQICNFDISNRYIVYAKQDNSWSPSSEIYRANLDFSNEIQFTSNSDCDCLPRISPDSQKVVWLYDDGDAGGTTIYKMNIDGSMKTKLLAVAGGQSCGNPMWSPDAMQILFSFINAGQSDIYAMNADGSNLINLTNTPDFNETPSDWRLFAGNRPGAVTALTPSSGVQKDPIVLSASV